MQSKRRGNGRKLRYQTLEPRNLLTGDTGISISSTSITTPHDVIPRFVATPTDTVVKDGNWSDGSIWADGSVPTAIDLVRIEEGFSIRYDVSSECVL